MATGRRSATYSLLLLAPAALGCGSPVAGPLGTAWHRAVGMIDNGGLPIEALGVPDTVRAGVPFVATVVTFGSSCIHPDGVELQLGGALATITPYDSVPSQPPPCLADFRAFPRSFGLVFNAPGAGVVRLQGRGFDGDLTLERSVTVRP